MESLVIGTNIRRKNSVGKTVHSALVDEDASMEFKELCKQHGYNQGLIFTRAIRIAIKQIKEIEND